MTISVESFDGGPINQRSYDAGGAGRFIKAYFLLAFSGSYVTGGDTLDLTNGGGTPAAPSGIPPATTGGVANIKVCPRSSKNTGLAAAGGLYAVLTPNADAPLKSSDLSTLKLKIFANSAGSITEYSAGAYGSDVLADQVILEVDFTR